MATTNKIMPKISDVDSRDLLLFFVKAATITSYKLNEDVNVANKNKIKNKLKNKLPKGICPKASGNSINKRLGPFGLAPDHGPSLLFIVLPEAFGQMPLGSLFLSLFLILFLFATLTSSFSLYEVIVAAFTKNSKRSRESTSLILGMILF